MRNLNSLLSNMSKIFLIRFLFIYGCLILFSFLVGRGNSIFISLSSAAQVVINGAGATFPYPLYMKWISEYRKINDKVQFNYQPIGSSGGVTQLLKGTVDFAASDIPLTAVQLKAAPWPVLQIPSAVGAIAIIYNLPSIGKEKGQEKILKVDGNILANIFKGKIIKWNDPSILALNPGATLPKQDILVVHRSDGSGTSAIFTAYLLMIDNEWKKLIGSSTTIAWPAGVGAKGNDGVTAMVKQSVYAIGYVELAYAINNKMAIAELKNLQGNFVLPNLENIQAAVNTFNSTNDITNANLLNRSGKSTYPITAFTYLVIPNPTNQSTNLKIKALKDFIKWGLTAGQELAPSLHYAPLSKSLSDKLVKQL